MNDDPRMTKERLREKSKRVRAAMSLGACQRASELICEHVGGWVRYRESETVLTYMPMRKEVELTPLFAGRGPKQWAIPRIEAQGRMRFHLYDPSRLVRHAFGMLEPNPGCPEIPPEEIDLALVPGLAFDSAGWRLGYGGGFYDRFLSGFGGDFAGVTYQDLLLEQVPHDAHDIAMQFVITESGIIPTA
jgi:5-formyltetrahydrofolate cyclo-ligase